MLTVENKTVVYVRECDNKKIEVYKILDSDNIDFDYMENDEIIQDLISNEKIWFDFEISKVSEEITTIGGFNQEIIYVDVEYILTEVNSNKILENIKKTEEIATTRNITKFLKKLENDNNLLYELFCEKNNRGSNIELLTDEYLYVK